jgi:hypothetical protein
MAQGRDAVRPQRGRMCITAGLDLRGQSIHMATTPTGSHNKNNGAIVRHLRSRPLAYMHIPQVKTCGYA